MNIVNLFQNSIAWMIFPRLFSSFVLKLYYSIGGKRPNASEKARKDRHLQNAHLIVLLLYFSYSIYNNFSNRDKTYYEVMGVSRSDDLAHMRRLFRQKMLQSHPDKQNASSVSADFHNIKEVYEVLNSDVLRLAYDSYGPEILQTAKKQSAGKQNLSDLFLHYLVGAGSYYFAAFIALLVHSFLNGWKNFFYRSLITFLAMICELYVTMRPLSYGSPAKHGFFNDIPLFIKVDLMRQISLNAGILLTYLTKSSKSPQNLKTVIDGISKSLKRDVLKELENEESELLNSLSDSEKIELRSKITSNIELLVNKN